MRGFKRLGILMLVGVMSLTACTSDRASTITKYQLMSDEDILVRSKVQGSTEELKGIVYQFVTGNLRIDKENLISPTGQELELITTHMDKVHSAIKGKENASIDDGLINYMLLEFAKTQKSWRVSKDGVQILGIDPATRKIFVDVLYETTLENKVEIAQSNIIRGDPRESQLKELRYTEYMAYMALKHGEITSNSLWAVEENEAVKKARELEASTALKAFEAQWGTVSLVLEEQQERTLIQRLRNAILHRDSRVATSKEPEFYTVTGETNNGQVKQNPLSDAAMRYIEASGLGTYTYTGITKQTTFDDLAFMTFRFILDFDFNLGAETTVNTSSVYLLDYVVNGYENTLASMEISDSVSSSLSVVTPYVDRLINSYHKAWESSNYRGLFTIFGFSSVKDDYTGKVLSSSSRFADWDKYYSDVNKYAYLNFDAYDYEIVGWEGQTLRVLVTRSKKIRGKGSDMTMPTYEEKALLTLNIDSDTLYLESDVPLETKIVGEPVSMIKDVTGIADKIAYNERSFTPENEVAVLEAIKTFSKLQLEYANDQSTPLVGSVDYGMGTVALEDMKTIMSNIVAPEKIVWLGTWASKSNVYVRVRVREYFKANDRDIDTEAYISLVNRSGTWTVVGYERVVATPIAISDVQTKGCLTHDKLGGESTSDYQTSTEVGGSAPDTSSTGYSSEKTPVTESSTAVPDTTTPGNTETPDSEIANSTTVDTTT